MNIDNVVVEKVLQINADLEAKFAEYENLAMELRISRYRAEELDLKKYEDLVYKIISILISLKDKDNLLTKLINKIIVDNLEKMEDYEDPIMDALLELFDYGDVLSEDLSNGILDIIQTMVSVKDGEASFEYLEKEIQSLLYNNIKKYNLNLSVIEFNILSASNFNKYFEEYLEKCNLIVDINHLLDIKDWYKIEASSARSRVREHAMYYTVATDGIDPFNFETEMREIMQRRREIEEPAKKYGANFIIYSRLYDYLDSRRISASRPKI